MDVISLEDYLKLDCGLYPKSLSNYVRVKDMSHIEIVKTLMDISEKLRIQNPFVVSLYAFSITGGFCRNELLGVTTNTDIDVVYGNSEILEELSKYFKRVETGNAAIDTFEVPGNTMHLLPYPFFYTANDMNHVFIKPTQFDFTLNLGCISAVDGWLYAPPITLFDAKHKILRPTVQPCIDETFGVQPQAVALTAVLLRAIRFHLKYGLTLHDSIIAAMKVLFSLQRELKSIDDVGLWYALKHFNDDPEEVRTGIYNVMRSVCFIDTDKYDNFDDYFKYIEERKNTNPRRELVVTRTPRTVHY